MDPSIEHDEKLRTRTLGFHIPRPGAWDSTRFRQPQPPTTEQVAAEVEAIPNAAPVRGFEVCISRRRVVLAELEDGRHVLVKWPDLGSDQEQGRELRMFGLLASMPLPDVTRVALPQVLAWDDGRMTSVYDAVQPCASMRDLFDNDALSSAQIAALAKALSGLHRTAVPEFVARDGDLAMTLPAPRSTLLSVQEYSYGLGLEFDAWLRVIQGLEGELERLHAEWEQRSLIHFDLRDDNILFVPPGDERGPVRIIDWEFACYGDPDYDVAYVIAQFFLHALRRRPQEARTALPASVLHQIGTFLSAYLGPEGTNRAALVKKFSYAGLLLLQNASSRLEQFGSLGRIGHLCLVIAEGLIRRPETLLRHLTIAAEEPS